MKIAVFYQDVFQTGGVPGEVLSLANAMAEHHSVFIWGRTGTIPSTLKPSIECSEYANLKSLGRSFPNWLLETKPDFLLLVGFFLYDNLSAARIARKYKIPVTLNPLAQVTDQVLAGKIFTQDPDVRNLEQVGLKMPYLKEKIAAKINPLAKRVYLNSFGRIILQSCNRIAVFSDHEAEQFQKHLPISDKRFVKLRWGIDAPPEEQAPAHYYKETLGYNDDKANFVYWGRLDWHYKGIDRLLAGVAECARQAENNVPFRLFLIGPDYNGGVDKIQQYIRQRRLESIIHLMLPGSYPAGSKTPLRDASASIYLSRWDGFPRTLRESTALNVPVLVSRETHFGELVSAFESGIALADADNPRQVAESLLRLTKKAEQERFQAGAARLTPDLTWQQVTKPLIDDCIKITANNLSERVAF